MKAFDLLVVGDANPDVLLTGAPAIPPYGQAETLVASGALALGGSAAIVAHGAARLGMSTALAAMVGRDAAGDFVLDVLSSAGVDVRACTRHETLPTALTVCLGGQDGDRAILTAPGCLPAFGPKHIPDFDTRHVHAASYFLQPLLATGLAEVFRRTRAAGRTTSLDTNHDPAGRWRLEAGLLEATDVFLPNAAEALALGVTATAGTTAVKHGRDGATVRAGDRTLTARGPELAPVDTVGAGDSFDAGFLAGLLSTGDLAIALALGCACGALSTRAAGGVAAQPDIAEAGTFADGIPVQVSQADSGPGNHTFDLRPSPP